MFDDLSNCQAYNTLSESITINETLRKFLGRCPFKVYMPNKPGKYGILFRVLTDAKAPYVYKMIPYAGKAEGQERSANPSSQHVLDLIQPISNSGPLIATTLVLSCSRSCAGNTT